MSIRGKAMKKFFQIFLSIFISILILTAILIPTVFSSGFNNANSNDLLNVKWYYSTPDGEVEVNIPSKIDVASNQTCTIYGYIEASDLLSPTLAIRTSYQKLDIYLDDELIYKYDTTTYRPYGKSNPSKIHYISLPN